MKLAIVVFLAFASFATVLASDLEERFSKAHEKCNADPSTALQKEDLRKWAKKLGPEPANLGVHILCVSKAVGWQDENGKISKEAVRKQIDNSFNDESVDEVSKECLVEKENAIETAKHLTRCLFLESHEKHALPDITERFAKAQEKCNADPTTALEKEDLSKLRQRVGPASANFGVHALCLSKALGWQDENGKILKEAVRKQMDDNISEESVEPIARACLIEKENAIETAKHLIECLFEDKNKD